MHSGQLLRLHALRIYLSMVFELRILITKLGLEMTGERKKKIETFFSWIIEILVLPVLLNLLEASSSSIRTLYEKKYYDRISLKY